MPGNFAYHFNENYDLRTSTSKTMDIEIGRVRGDPSTEDDICRTLGGVEVETVEDGSWNCQSWAKTGMVAMNGLEGVEMDVTPDAATGWLSEQVAAM